MPNQNVRAIVTWNVLFDLLEVPGILPWSQRRHLVAGILRDADADVIGVQEASPAQVAYLAEQLPQFDTITHTSLAADPLLRQLRARYGEALSGDIGELAIFVRRTKFDVRQVRHWWLSPTPEIELSTGYGKDVPRLAIAALAIDRATGTPFTFVTTHVDRTAPFEQTDICRSQLETDIEAGRSCVLFGDLNSDVDARGVDALVAGRWVDAPVDAPTWMGDADSPPARIDHVLFHSDSLRLMRTQLLDDSELLSDHRPVKATFAIQTA